MKLFTNDGRLSEAVEVANAYFLSPDFRSDVVSLKIYDDANVTAEKILELFDFYSTKNRPVEVKCSFFGYFHRKVIGKTIGDGFVYFNSWHLSDLPWEVVGCLVHESSHVVDEFFPDASFGHGGNSPGGKENTFPYHIGTCASVWAKREYYKKSVQYLTAQIEQRRAVCA